MFSSLTHALRRSLPAAALAAGLLSLTPAGALAAPGPAAAAAVKPAGEKEKDIRRLLELTGAGKLGEQVMVNMLGSFRKSMPNVPAEFWDSFAKEAKPEDLVNMVVPVYDKHLSHDDIKATIAFYETPAGKNLIAALPQITQESMMAGQKWGMELGQKVQAKLQAGAPK